MHQALKKSLRTALEGFRSDKCGRSDLRRFDVNAMEMSLISLIPETLPS